MQWQMGQKQDDDITLAWVPGAFEIPLTAQKMAETGNYDAVICLGAVIKGATTHYDYVCAEVSKGVAAVGLKTEIPVIFGVVTTDNIEQAIERAGTKAGNKGYDAACTAIEMVNLVQIMEQGKILISCCMLSPAPKNSGAGALFSKDIEKMQKPC